MTKKIVYTVIAAGLLGALAYGVKYCAEINREKLLRFNGSKIEQIVNQPDNYKVKSEQYKK